MRVLLTVGDIVESKLPENGVLIHCDDLEDMLEHLEDISNDLHCDDEYIVVVGNNVIEMASWGDDGVCYGTVISGIKVVNKVRSMFDGWIL